MTWRQDKTLWGLTLGLVALLLLNFVVLLFISMMIEGPMKDPLAFGWPQSAPVLDEAALPKLVPKSRLHVGFVIAVAAAEVGIGLAIVLLIYRNRRSIDLSEADLLKG